MAKFTFVRKTVLTKYMRNLLNLIFGVERNTVVSASLIDLELHDLTTLKWVVFLDVIKTEKHELLHKEYKKTNEYTEEQKMFFKTAWVNLQDDVYKLEDNKESQLLLKDSFARLLLVEKIRLIEGDANLLIWLLDKEKIYRLGGELDVFDEQLQSIYAMIEFHEPRAKMNKFADPTENLKILELVIASMVNEYNVKYNEIERKSDKLASSIFYNVLQVNKITGLNLNAMTMVCAEWLEAKKIANEMAIQQSKSLQK